MSLRHLMLMDLARARQIVHGGHEVVPTWRILTPEDDFILLTRLDPDKHGQRQRMLTLIPRFMRWKMATAFTLTVETWLGPGTRSGEEAMLAVGVSQTERLGAMHRVQRLPYVRFYPVEWLRADQIDETFFTLLPSGPGTISATEAAELATIFGEDGELPARRLT